MRSVHASAAAMSEEHRLEHRHAASSPSVYHASSNGRGWSATWNTGVMPCSTNAPRRGRGRDATAARPSTSAGAIIASRTPGGLERAQLRVEPVEIAQRRCATGMQTPRAVGDDRRAPAVPRAPCSRSSAGNDRLERAFPQQPVVREQDRLVDAEVGEPGARAPPGSSGRRAAGRRSACRAARRGARPGAGGRWSWCRRAAAPRRARGARRATPARCSRRRRRPSRSLRRGWRGRCAPPTTRGTRRGVGPSRSLRCRPRGCRSRGCRSPEPWTRRMPHHGAGPHPPDAQSTRPAMIDRGQAQPPLKCS